GCRQLGQAQNAFPKSGAGHEFKQSALAFLILTGRARAAPLSDGSLGGGGAKSACASPGVGLATLGHEGSGELAEW
ncbi:MAG: hypothetical protein AAGL99_17145, partial [Pseudomonadota bacterium]